MLEYEEEFAEWEMMHKLASKILSNDSDAYLSFLEAKEPFDDIIDLGSSIEFISAKDSLIEVELHVDREEIIPTEIKQQTKSGKLSEKDIPKTKFYELYQDHICSCILYIARELFALLPVEVVVIHAVGEILNTQTGHEEVQAILSAAITRTKLEELNIDMIDPSDSMKNFSHNMKFKRVTGFEVVERLNPTDYLK